MNRRVVLDAGAFEVLNTRAGAKLRDLLAQTVSRGGEIWCPAVTIAEVARGTPRTRQVEAALSRSYGGEPVRVLVTDASLAKQIGAILYATEKGSESMADAHVVAACLGADVAVVATTDPDDIVELSAAVPGVKIMPRTP